MHWYKWVIWLPIKYNGHIFTFRHGKWKYGLVIYKLWHCVTYVILANLLYAVFMQLLRRAYNLQHPQQQLCQNFRSCDARRNALIRYSPTNLIVVAWSSHHDVMTCTYQTFCIIDPLLEYSLQWRHNDHDGVSNHQPQGCLLNRLFGRRSKKTSKLRVTGLCAGNSPGPVNSPHKGPVTRKMFPFMTSSCSGINDQYFLSFLCCCC